MACAICNNRREKRHCPGVQGEICTICCGEQREETIACPFDCEYLRIARQHENQQKKDPAGMPSPASRMSSDFMKKNVQLVTVIQHATLMASLRVNAVDNDVKEALDGLVRTYRTLESGLYYESRPANPMAAAVFDAIQHRVAELRQAESQSGVHKILDSQILTILVFLQQMEYAFNNGRKKGRCFLDNLRRALGRYSDERKPDPAPLLVS
jgi:hypothetical protein